MNRIKVPALILPFGMLVFVAAATVLARTHGAPGIAFATTLSALSVFVAMMVTLSRTVEQFPWRQVGLPLLGYCALGAAVMGIVMAAVHELAFSPLAATVASLPAGVIIYFGVLGLSGDPALRLVTRYGRRWFATRSVSA
jgi:peptidoglycan biosynthesis protein MviN/MurJ (putative lipid II flippase)